MLTSRRGLIGRLGALVAGGAAAWRVSATPARADDAGVPRVAYHLADTEKVQFVLGNIANHIEGMGGPDKVHIVLVVHGPALLQFRKAKATPDLAQRFSKVAPHIGLAACGNTMKAQELTLDDLLPGFVRVDEGGVVRLAKLQAEGYAYLRP
ncbi:MAG TPA: DsrE family protein [Bauldia sp.]|nr:DsrE family protein [Bauldia sp.]